MPVSTHGADDHKARATGVAGVSEQAPRRTCRGVQSESVRALASGNRLGGGQRLAGPCLFESGLAPFEEDSGDAGAQLLAGPRRGEGKAHLFPDAGVNDETQLVLAGEVDEGGHEVGQALTVGGFVLRLPQGD